MSYIARHSRFLHCCSAFVIVIASQTLFSSDAAETGFLRKIEMSSPTYIERTADGRVIGLTVPFPSSRSDDFVAIKQLEHLTHLKLYVESATLSPALIQNLYTLPQLTNLTIACAQPVPIEAINALMPLRRLNTLTFASATPAGADYSALTNLVTVEHLNIIGAKAFDDKELRRIVQMPQLRTLRLDATSVSDQFVSVVRESPTLELVILDRGNETQRWQRK